MELNFRRMEVADIEARPGQVNDYGVQLLLFADARVYFSILDEAVTPTGWQRHQSRDNANCIVSIWDSDLQQWIEKEDTGTASAAAEEKGKASDSFKRACTCWGIGRELYTAPYMFIKKDKLPHYEPAAGNKKATCKDSFIVQDVKYAETNGDKTIVSITIGIAYYDKISSSVTFTKGSQSTQSPAPKSPQTQSTSNATKTSSSNQTATPQASNTASELSDTDIAVLYAKGELAGTSKDGIAEWVKKKFGVDDVTALTRAQYDTTCAALDKQAEKKKEA